MREKISIIIPCYNSTATLETVIAELLNAFSKLEKYDYEIILVNDASQDKTFDLIRKICETDSKIIGIDCAKNLGQHAAVMAGLSYSTGDLACSIDDDGQMPIESIHKMLNELEKGFDIVCGHFVERPPRSVFRRFGTWINITVRDALLDIPKGIHLSIFFVAKRFLIDEILKYKNPYPYIPGLIFRATDNIGSVEVIQKDRIAGSSGYTFKKLFSHWMNGFTAFSVKPLRIATFIGLVTALIGLIVAIIIIINRFMDSYTVAGWVSTIASTLIIGGIIMFMLGLIGEYVGRIYMSINESPQYVVRKVINKKDI